MRIAIDTGGTFTDIVYLQNGKLVVLKIFSTPADPGKAVLEGLSQVVASSDVVVRHGTTVGTNAMLERKGGRVAFLTTKGFEDTIAIGRQARPKLYDWFQPAPDCLAPKELRFGIGERVNSRGEILADVDPLELERLVDKIAAAGVDAVAVSLLFSFANATNEMVVGAACERLGVPLSVSHRILPEFREYERASTVVANAYVAPKVGSYISKLAASVSTNYAKGRLEVMQSSGGIISARLAAAEPVRTVLSGPAGGVIGAYKLAQLAGFDRIIGFDMGGTSTDVCLVDAATGGPRISNESMITGIPIAIPMLDIHTAGAGGGSIARFDSGGLLHVGPESAGSCPGPICFGRGTLPTVTDANLALGKARYGSLSGRLSQARSRTHDAVHGPSEGKYRHGRGVRRRYPATHRDLDGEGDSSHLCRARLRSPRLHAGCLWRWRPAACVFSCARSACAARAHSRAAGCALGCRYSACRYHARVLPHGHAGNRR